MSIASVELSVRPLLALRGVKHCFVVARTEDNVRADTIPHALALVVRQLGRDLLDGPEDRRSQCVLEHQVVARRFGDVVVCVVGDESMVENDVLRKFNVIAIRIHSTRTAEPINPLVPALRESYVECAGPLSGLSFDRAFDDLRRSRGGRDASTLRTFVQALASGLTPPWNQRFLERAEIILRNADTPSGSFIAAALTPITPQAFPVPGLPPQPPAAAPFQRPRTVPRMAAVQQVTRDHIGPLGDLIVRRAIESTGSNFSDAASAERLIDAIAQQLPEHKRPRFRAESRAALAAAEDGKSDDEGEPDRDSSEEMPQSSR